MFLTRSSAFNKLFIVPCYCFFLFVTIIIIIPRWKNKSNVKLIENMSDWELPLCLTLPFKKYNHHNDLSHRRLKGFPSVMFPVTLWIGKRFFFSPWVPIKDIWEECQFKTEVWYKWNVFDFPIFHPFLLLGGDV